MSSTSEKRDKLLQGSFFQDPLASKRKAPEDVRKKKVIVISGPTSVGKTEISCEIAKAIGGEIVSADSMQVYRGMDVGTAKPSLDMRKEVLHHLIDSRDLDESYNVVDFYHEATQALKEIFARNHVPMVVGGTGFYIQALMLGPPSGPPSVPEVRDRLEKELDLHGTAHLYERLLSFDPEYAKKIMPHDQHKIIRALEIITLTQKKVSEFLPAFPREDGLSCDFRPWFLFLPRELLYEKIEKRCDEMLKNGLIEEVAHLINEGLPENRTASQAIGYKQTIQFLKTKQSEEDKEKFSQEFKRASKRYAKRQLTWFRKQPEFRWLNLATISKETAIEMIIQDYEQR